MSRISLAHASESYGRPRPTRSLSRLPAGEGTSSVPMPGQQLCLQMAWEMERILSMVALVLD
jgi:hypothetical protein